MSTNSNFSIAIKYLHRRYPLLTARNTDLFLQRLNKLIICQFSSSLCYHLFPLTITYQVYLVASCNIRLVVSRSHRKSPKKTYFNILLIYAQKPKRCLKHLIHSRRISSDCRKCIQITCTQIKQAFIHVYFLFSTV